MKKAIMALTIVLIFLVASIQAQDDITIDALNDMAPHWTPCTKSQMDAYLADMMEVRNHAYETWDGSDIAGGAFMDGLEYIRRSVLRAPLCREALLENLLWGWEISNLGMLKAAGHYWTPSEIDALTRKIRLIMESNTGLFKVLQGDLYR